MGMTVWGIVMMIGGLGYLAFLKGIPGNYWLTQAYGFLIWGAAAVAVLTAPLLGLAFVLLAIASLHPDWRSRTRQGAKKLLLILLIEAMVIFALLSGIVVGDVTDRLAVAPWQVVYRAIYLSPLDNNYGDLMLVKCRWFGFCRQVYRSYTDMGSAEEAYLQFNADANQVKLHLEGRWVYRRSPGSPACKEILRSDDPHRKCDPAL